MAMGWTDNAVYRKIQQELGVKTADDFERSSLRLLRLIWPAMINTPRRRKFDIAGADLLVWSDTPPFPVVVQCKGWEVSDDELGPSQIAKCKKSIESFVNGGLEAERYILVHNRTGKNELFRTTVQKELEKLVQLGLVKSAELWTRQQLAQEAFEALYKRFIEQAPQTNLNYHNIFHEMEQVRWEPIEQVPLTSRLLKVDQYRLVASSLEENKTADPCEEMLSAAEKMAILIGPAGFGKSTAAFRLTQRDASRFIYIPAASITNDVRTTTDLFRQAISCADLLKDSLPEDYPLHETIAREVIALTLKNERVPLTVIFDGLDESVLFNKKGGLQHLMNIIKDDVRGPVILTARSEYWHRKEADFSTSFGITGTKVPRRVRDILLIELQEWDESKMLELLARFRGQSLSGEQSERLDKLEALIKSGEYSKFYGDIPRRPLFLRFIIDTVLEKDPHQVSRTELFYEWICQKILRDIGNPQQFGGSRVPIASENSDGATIELAFLAMTKAAALMTQTEQGTLQLLPSCNQDDLLASHPRLEAITDPVGLVLNSLLVPIRAALGEGTRLGFAHRSFQEYFLARAINEGFVNVKGMGLPSSVTEWM
jgi:hypothetical protein